MRVTSTRDIGVARILDWGGGPNQKLHRWRPKKKESSQFDLGFVIGVGPKFSWRPILNWGGAKSQVTEWGPNLKNNWTEGQHELQSLFRPEN